jgi:hypothetical protein
MGTRSTIAIEYADGTVEQVYCHWDGYLENNGALLAVHYKDPFKVRALMDLGDLSSLAMNLGEQHSFDTFHMPPSEREQHNQQHKDSCTFYGRDRSEEGVGATKFIDYKDYIDNHQYEEFEYILRNVDSKAVWFVSDHSGNYVELTKAMADSEVFV